MQPSATAGFIDRAAFARIADYLAVVVAMSLPWSSSATSIAVVLWLLVLVPTLDIHALRREIMTPAGGLPLALFAFGALGMAWADVTLMERLHGLESFIKILAIPLLLVQFRQSERGVWPLIGFLVSATVLLAASFATIVTPGNLWGWGKHYGVPVKDYIAQAGEFSLCAFGTFYLAQQAGRDQRWLAAAGWSLLACAFLADIFYVTSSRTALITIPILIVLFATLRFSGKTRLGVIALGIAGLLAVWMTSPVVRSRLTALSFEIRHYRNMNLVTSAGERIEFWNKALVLLSEAPILGHGTGSIRELYRRAAEGKTGIAGEVAANPHNQTFAVAIQLGLTGTILLYAMWIAHFLLFVRSSGMASLVGLFVVVQNVVGSMFNSHLFDFTQGWIYAFGVGIAGGLALAQSRGVPVVQNPAHGR